MSGQKGLEAYLDVEERESRRIDRDNLRKLIREILRYPGLLFSGVGMILIGTFATLLEPRLFGYAIDEAIIPKNWDLLIDLTQVFLLIVMIRVLMMIGQAYFFEIIGQRVCQNLRIQLFSHLQRLPVSVYDKTPAGRLLTRVTNDVASLSDMFTAGFVSMISNLLIVLGVMVWLLILDLKLGLIAATVFPPLIALSVYFSRRLKVAYREARSKLSALNAFLAENLMGMKVVHLFGRQRLHLERFDRVNQWYADAQVGTIRVFALFQPTINMASGISLALVIYYGTKQTLDGEMRVGVLVAFFSYILTLFQPIREVADKWNVFLSGMASAERIFSVLSWSTETEVANEKIQPLAGIRGHIVFENVWFAYETDHWVLKDFSLEIQPGMQVGVVGHTGAGKTTLISLLMRFYEPQRGRILLDGKDLREYDKRALRASIGIIQQDVFLFSGSFKDNIGFWDDQAVSSEVREALEDLGYKRWLESGEKLQERGSNVSMGEKQVLAFARALAAKPSIWILDEATANMDSETETKLQRSLEQASTGKTSILIAHRLATVRNSDLIIVLHKGVLVENGTHEELIAGEGLYARLYRYQESQREEKVGSVSGL